MTAMTFDRTVAGRIGHGPNPGASPLQAGILGSTLGPLGLAIHFRDWKAIWLPALVTCGVPLVAPGPGLIAAWAFCGCYGYLRALIANEKFRTLEAPPMTLARRPTEPNNPEDKIAA